MAERGKFLVVEGGVGCGKTTQLAKISKVLGDNWKYYLEPGSTAFGTMIRGAVQGRHGFAVDKYAATFAYCAARANLVRGVIIPKLEEGIGIGLDRYRYSTEAYQTAEGVPFVIVWCLNQIATKGLKPNLVLHYDLLPETGIERKRKGSAEADIDRYDEMDPKFHAKVRSNYLWIRRFHPGIWRTIDGRGSVDEVYERSVEVLNEFGLIDTLHI
jgi:dTMP kinase